MPLKASKIVLSRIFTDAYVRKSEQHRKSIEPALAMMKNNVFYPSLKNA